MAIEEHTHYPGRPHPCDDAHPRLTATLVRFRDAMNDPACNPSTLRPFFTDDKPVCIEHGPADVVELPFLGKPYEGEQAILEYFNLIGTVLKGRGSRLHEDDLVVKVLEKNHVHMARAIWTGEATWSVAKTGKEWDEHVVWAFDWLREGREWKIQRWEVWADPLSAYLATKP